jgi:serine/threonine protein kinase
MFTCFYYCSDLSSRVVSVSYFLTSLLRFLLFVFVSLSSLFSFPSASVFVSVSVSIFILSLCPSLGGTPAYLSPEQLDGKLTNGYTKVVDWWSYGVLVYELLTGTTPFCKNNRESHYEIFLRILKSKISFPFSFDSKSKELIQGLCHANIEKRLTDHRQIKQHSYYEMPWDMVEQRKLIPPFVPKLKDDGDAHYFSNYKDSGLPPNYHNDGKDGSALDEYDAQSLFFSF